MTLDDELFTGNQYRITADYHLNRIIKWLIYNRAPESVEVLEAYGNNVSGAVIDILEYLCKCEKTVTAIREAIANV